MTPHPPSKPPRLSDTKAPGPSDPKTPDPEPSKRDPLAVARETTSTLLPHLRISLYTPSPSPITNPLSALHDTASIISAHATRLSLALRPPISIPEAAHELQELLTFSSALVAACTSVFPPTHTQALTSEVQRLTSELLRAIEELVEQNGRGRLVDTGVVWAAVKVVQGLRDGGDRGAVGRRVLVSFDMVKDCESEMRVWVNGIDDEDEEGFSDEEEELTWRDKATKLSSEEMRQMAENAAKRLKSVQLVFLATLKRRLADGAEGTIKSVERLDKVAEGAKYLEFLADEIGGPFYEDGDVKDVAELLKEFDNKAIELVDLLMPGDDGQEDKHSPWFQTAKKAFIDSP